jgi:hypothetical protein
MVIFRTTLLTSVLLLCSTGVGGDIVPLGYGNRWECIDEATGAEEFTEITGTTSIWGREFWVLEHMEGGANEGLVIPRRFSRERAQRRLRVPDRWRSI